MRRRAALGGLAAAAAAPWVAAQPPGRPYRIGILGARSQIPWENLRTGLRELGYAENSNIVFEGRWSDGFSARLPALARELAALEPDVIVTSTSLMTAAVRAATQTIPIVMTMGSYPRELGLVRSYAAPGGNGTGLTTDVPGIATKRLELLRELAPRAARLAVLCSRASLPERLQFDELQDAAARVAATLDPIDFDDPDALDRARAALEGRRADALVALISPAIFQRSSAIAGLAFRNRLPSLFEDRLFVDYGGLLSYGPDLRELFRRAATYVDRILRGAKPSELPVELPVRFELAVNRATASHLGLTIPASLRARADAIVV